jgi:hypothetical protein
LYETKRVEFEERLKQLRTQRPVDRRHASKRVVERALTQRPEIDIAASRRQGPSVFKLLRPLDFGEPIGVGTRRSAMAPDCGVHVEQLQ